MRFGVDIEDWSGNVEWFSRSMSSKPATEDPKQGASRGEHRHWEAAKWKKKSEV